MYRHTHTKSASSLVPNSNSRKIKVKFDHPDPVKLFCCEVKEQQEASNKCQDQTDQQMLLLLPFKKPAVAVAKVMNTKKIWFTHYHNWTPGHHSHEVSSQQQSYLPGEAQKLDMTWQQYTQIFFSKSKIQPLSSLFWTLKDTKFLSFLLAEIPSRKFMFLYALRNEFLRSGNEFHRFLFSKEIHLPPKTVKFSS